jgi:hypothetical protein
MRQAFTSAGAELVELAFDGTLVMDTSDVGEVDRLVQAQLMFSIGELNGDSSVARIDRAAYDVRSVTPLPSTPPTYEVGYAAKLPVAWGAGSLPSSYDVVLPKRLGDSDQAAFALKYNGTCTDPEGGAVTAGDMFLFFRPRQAGCSIDADDVMVTQATVNVSTNNTTSKYPEYDRVWDDGELDVIAMFGRELPDGSGDDEGVRAYATFVAKMRDALLMLQPDARRRGEQVDTSTNERNVRLTATLPEGWRVRIDVVSTSSSLRAGAVDAWYDARSSDADAIIYSGHAGLGDNVRALMTKGVFRPRKYVVMVMNGCDTFAYVDDTLAKRRAALNPDDPSGSRYMDTVTNVLGAYFHSGSGTASDLVDAFVDAARGAPKTYRQIFGTVDPTQLIVVDGEQDNEFVPSMAPVAPASWTATATASSAPASQTAPSPSSSAAASMEGGSFARCSFGYGDVETSLSDRTMLAPGAVLLLLRYRRRSRASLVQRNTTLAGTAS